MLSGVSLHHHSPSCGISARSSHATLAKPRPTARWPLPKPHPGHALLPLRGCHQHRRYSLFIGRNNTLGSSTHGKGTLSQPSVLQSLASRTAVACFNTHRDKTSQEGQPEHAPQADSSSSSGNSDGSQPAAAPVSPATLDSVTAAATSNQGPSGTPSAAAAAGLDISGPSSGTHSHSRSSSPSGDQHHAGSHDAGHDHSGSHGAVHQLQHRAIEKTSFKLMEKVRVAKGQSLTVGHRDGSIANLRTSSSIGQHAGLCTML